MVITRRDMLKLAAAVTAAANLSGAVGCAAGNPLTWLDDVEPIGDLDEAEVRILALAGRSPSTHNTQPWIVRVDGPGQWTVLADPERALAVVDKNRRELILSIGGFLESMQLAAGALGRTATIRVISTDRFAHELATVTFAGGPMSGLDVSQLESRRTVRAKLSSTELTPEQVAASLDSVRPAASFYPRQSPIGEYLSNVTLEAFEQQTRNDAAQAELADWTRLGAAEARALRDGLTAEMLDISGVQLLLVRALGVSVTGSLYRDQSISTTGSQLSQGAGWVVMTSPTASVGDLIDSGRQFLRLAIAAQSQGIGVHPMSQALEESPFRDAVADAMGVPGHVQWLLRVGRVDPFPRPVSPRLPVAEFLA